MALLTRAQLIDRLGGPTAARQLLDPQNTSDPMTGDGFFNDRLDASIRDALGDVEAAFGSRYSAAAANPSDKLTRIAGQLAEYYAWGRNKTKAMPDTVKQFFGGAKGDLKDIEASVSNPGGDTVSRFPRTLDNSRLGTRAVWSSWRRGGANGGR